MKIRKPEYPQKDRHIVFGEILESDILEDESLLDALAEYEALRLSDEHDEYYSHRQAVDDIRYDRIRWTGHLKRGRCKRWGDR